MSADWLLGHLAYAIGNATVHQYPFPHIYVPNVMPPAYYKAITACLPPPDDYVTGSTRYNGRKFGDPSTLPLLKPFLMPRFAELAAYPFLHYINARFEGKKCRFSTDLRLVMDAENYAIGPHTDAPWKVLSLLFYLPRNDDLLAHGTSIYIPNDPAFRCQGGPHHKFPDFTRVHTAPFAPNSLFAFFKTDNSFHGVEPITIPCRRDVLLWNLYEGRPTT